jgi:hypothetical protein
MNTADAGREFPYWDEATMFPPPFKRHRDPERFKVVQVQVLDFFMWCSAQDAAIAATGPMLYTQVAGQAREAFSVRVHRAPDRVEMVCLGGYRMVCFEDEAARQFERMLTESQDAARAAGFEVSKDDIAIVSGVQAAAALTRGR